ncbi:uncharacterized protein BDCG_03980 [Blastomyces dermatitidis ER-3]|uniref:Vacuolar sorting protein Vps3844 C-terminal domain-containing protein n=3 Tax=Blastomyces TaxID=229219 RepID=A0A179U9A8_BLAGS|nr:uncharacterized protein BDBG_00970 [Blastomyces gilchristii SLH14081]XP_045275901.1 uncharacterized protein BDCG_03980 [Blastomyces dermatitidis ER-3]EGE81732.1 hypothetical protein BDDG_04675 [Blastomyces dermatitidis ATCC 18188]EQL31389.1 hypothetical protein BDFG_06214 [Blastomyces dermatitidis ATCC 26199]EEQ88860.1 hypothetical protein BDCG_03980 [Blastomyces dermatitidis ER-3]OAT04420.1 hypothetical protein BDBG_00970 [Blastomyces gilchristii SLH14081]
MRRLLSFLPLSLAAITGVAAYDARAYTFDTRQQSVPPVNRVVTPETARLILASRLDLADGSTLGQVDEILIRDLNTFGGAQTPIMGDTSVGDCSTKMALVWEGVDVPDLASVSKYSTDSFTIPSAPADLVSESFVENLLTHSSAMLTTSKPCLYDFEVDGRLQGTLILNANQCPSKKDVFSATSSILEEAAFRQFLARGAKGWGGECATAILRLSSTSNTPAVRKTVFATIAELSILAKDSKQDSVMIFTSPSPSYHTLKYRSEETKPGLPNTIQARSSRNVRRGHKFPSTMMPVCYSSNETCTEATNNCSGHGSCYRKFASKENAKGDCFACKCHRTVVRTNDDGTVKTVQWGGAACQKKDVSIPFFIIASLTILMVIAVTGGIRLLFSVGMEELPSVIGAGVAVPKPQK